MRFGSATMRFLAGTAIFFLGLGGAAAGQTTLRIGMIGPPSTLDPHIWTDPVNYRYSAQMYEAPLECVIDEKGLLQIVPAICELPVVSEDRKTLRLKVRKGARFHDDPCFEGGKGRDASAEDVAASLLRHADPDIVSQAFAPFVQGRFVGIDEWRQAAARQRGVDYANPPRGVRVEGDEVVLELTEPYPALRSLLSQPWASVVPIEAIRLYAATLRDHPVGTGPFRFAEKDAARIRLVKHDGYRIKGKPAVDEVRFEFVSDADARYSRFSLGELDLIEVVGSDEKQLVDSKQELLAAHKAKGRRLVDGAPLTVSYFAFNCASPLFEKPAMRRAVHRALDRAALAKALEGPRALIADGPLPKLFPEGSTFNAEPWPSGARDVAAARALVKEAGYADIKDVSEFKIDFPTWVDTVRSAQMRALAIAQLQEAGFRATERKGTFDEFYERAAKRDFSMAFVSWFADYPDAENFFLLFRSDVVSGGSWDSNYGRYGDSEGDRLYSELASLPPGKERLAAATTFLRKIRSEAAWVPISFTRGHSVVQRGWTGLETNLMNWSLRDAARK